MCEVLRAGFDVETGNNLYLGKYSSIAVNTPRILGHLAFIALLVSSILFASTSSLSVKSLAFNIIIYSGCTTASLFVIGLIANCSFVFGKRKNRGPWDCKVWGEESLKTFLWTIGAPFVFCNNVSANRYSDDYD